jgi:ribosomal protein S18 acetylase RimI-like enzyme
MQVTIRPATINDCPAMMQLINELAIYEKAPQEVTVQMDHFVQSGFGPNPVWWALIATPSPTSQNPAYNGGEKENETNNILGFALYYVRYSTWKGQRMYLEDIIVTEQARGKGIGAMLMDSLIAEAKQKKFNGITWQVLDWNEPAINFYKKYNAKFDPEWINCSLDF